MEIHDSSEMSPLQLAFKPKLFWDSEVESYFRKAYGSHRFDQMCDALCRPPLRTCVRVNTLQTTTAEVISRLNDILSASSSPSGGHVKYEYEEHPSLPDVVTLTGTGPHTIQYLDIDGPDFKEVVVSRKCAEAVLRGAQVFVPGVLACSSHVEVGDRLAVSVAVERADGEGGWISGCTRGAIIGSQHARQQVGELADRCKWVIGEGQAAMSRASIFRERNGVAVEMRQRVFDLPPCNGILPSAVFLQNLPSIVAARVMDPLPGERILDMCAAPGGKTTAMAVIMRDQGEVIALDRSHNKVNDIKRLASEMGLTCIKAYKMNSLKAVLSPISAAEQLSIGPDVAASMQGQGDDSDLNRSAGELEMATEKQHVVVASQDPGLDSEAKGPQRYLSRKEERKAKRRLLNGAKEEPGVSHDCSPSVKGFLPHSFDRVLLDAPCSALGLRPRLFAADISVVELRKHAVYQRRLFDQAVQLVKPGGVLVYSTCTINPGENEALVRYALDKYPHLQLEKQVPHLGGPGLVGGLDVTDGVGSREWLRNEEADLVQRFDPCDSLDTIGFFIAKFRVQ